jgi:acetolactate synthase-1/2/3 large subunit
LVAPGPKVAKQVRDAFRLAEEERPGAVHLELPEDVAFEEVKDWHIFPVHEIRRPDADQKTIEMAVEMIENAKNPLVLIGAGANNAAVPKNNGFSQLTTPLPICVLKNGIQVLSTKFCIDLNNFLRLAPAPSGTQVIHINFNSAQVDEVYFPQLEIVGDIKTTVNRLAQELELNNCSLELLAFIIKHKPLHLAIPRPLLLKHYQVRRY